MPIPVFLGEFEQFVLLAILQVARELRDDVPVHALRERLQALAGRGVSRGALYRTLDRLEEKGRVVWDVDAEDVPERGGHPRRRFQVTPDGIAVLRAAPSLHPDPDGRAPRRSTGPQHSRRSPRGVARAAVGSGTDNMVCTRVPSRVM
jgi:DNA-binding PadR family transcriptional regulator